MLEETPAGPVFNPWFEHDKEHDLQPDAPRRRWENLSAYLRSRRGQVRLLMVGEALGYQGGHFSGLAMTSERILLGHHRKKGIDPLELDLDLPTERTSRPEVKAMGFSEPTATIVWGAVQDCGLKGRDFVLWNAFPWHPYDPEAGLLSNRRPTVSELEEGRPAFEELRRLFPEAKVGAVGRVAERQLEDIGVPHVALRHPAHGGAPKFRAGLKELSEDLT
ncbi:MAG: uracil-DNA glycosylase [Anaerolineales bacterium]|nr:uracil-DNA glycosylase [Anaerolineales bacterium]